jgi:hypothetical protein
VKNGLVMAIDQDGQVWALCGKQGYWLNAGLPKQIGPVSKYAEMRSIFFPVNTNIMNKLEAKAIDIQVGTDQTYVLAEDKNGEKFVHFIGTDAIPDGNFLAIPERCSSIPIVLETFGKNA